MGGTSIVQAKASLLYALGRLKPSDRFNVIRFDNTMDVLFSDAVPADAEHVAQAKAFVSALEARGGTEMVPPMKAALTDRRGGDANTVRQVIFLTDGEIGNEQQLFETIGALRGRSRIFMVGIGSAPNSFLMTRAAELGRGTFTHIGSVEQVEERMRTLFGKLESPAVTNLTATFSAARAGRRRRPCIPDLYRGEPVALAAKVERARRHARDQGHDRRPAVGRHAAARQCRRRPRPVEALGAAQDRRRRGRAHAPADHAGRGRPAHSRARARAPSGDATDQPGRGRPDAEPSGRRASHPRRRSAQPAGRLGVRQGVRRRARARSGAGRTPRRRHAGRRVRDAYAAVAVARSAATGRAKFAAVATPRSGATLPKTATDAELRLWFGLAALLREPDPAGDPAPPRGTLAQCLPR